MFVPYVGLLCMCIEVFLSQRRNIFAHFEAFIMTSMAVCSMSQCLGNTHDDSYKYYVPGMATALLLSVSQQHIIRVCSLTLLDPQRVHS